MAAVGFKSRRLEIPSDVNPQVADIIESCWAKYVDKLRLNQFHLPTCFFFVSHTKIIFELQWALETTFVLYYHGIVETIDKATDTSTRSWRNVNAYLRAGTYENLYALIPFFWWFDGWQESAPLKPSKMPIFCFGLISYSILVKVSSNL